MKVFHFLGFLCLSMSVMAGNPLNTDWRGQAVKGYDVVAYFEAGKAVKGSSDHSWEWSGGTWRFSSAQNLAKFKENPAKYVPQYGGYCAWAVSQNSKANIDPLAWDIVEGKLYLNYSKKIQKKWRDDIPGFIGLANQNWESLKDK